MALPRQVTRDWRNTINVNSVHNNMTFSIAWKKNGKWVTLFRKFNLRIVRRNLLKGEFSSNLHFEDILDQENGNSMMIYGVPENTDYEVIDANFKTQSFDFLLYKEIFVLSKKDIEFYLPNFKYNMDWHARLNGTINKKNTIQLKLCKSRQLTHADTEDKIVITLPIFNIEEPKNNIL